MDCKTISFSSGKSKVYTAYYTIFLVLVLVHGISLSQEHPINFSSCTGAAKYLQGQ